MCVYIYIYIYVYRCIYTDKDTYVHRFVHVYEKTGDEAVGMKVSASGGDMMCMRVCIYIYIYIYMCLGFS